MSKQFIYALLCLAVSTPAFSQVYDVAAGQELASPITSYQKAQAERLRQEQMRLENERLQQEIDEQKREAQRREREQMRLQNEARERERARAAELSMQTNSAAQNAGPDAYEQLRSIGELRDDGILTEEEFQDLKKKILDEHNSSPTTEGIWN